MICAEAKFTASRPEAQKRLICTPAHTVAETRDQCRGARDIAAGLTDRIDHAHHHVVDQSGIEMIAALDGAERLACQIERRYFMQRAVDFAAAARGAHVIVDEGVGHELHSLLFPQARKSLIASLDRCHSPRIWIPARTGTMTI